MALSRILANMVSYAQAGVGAVTRYVQDKLRENISVQDFGAKGDGLSDDTAAVQAALNAVSALGGGVCRMPTGRYRLTSRVIIPAYVLLLGSGILIDPSNLAGSVKGTVLVIDWGAGSNQHAIEVGGTSGLEGVNFYYPGQAKKNASVPVEFGFSISTPPTAGVYDNIHIKNVNLYNSYRGIRLNNGGRWRVENVQGNPLLLGFTASDCYDACYMRSVHFWNFYTQSDVLENWVSLNGTAFEWWRVDQLFASDLFGWNYKICFHCRDGFWGSLSNVLCDKAFFPLLVSAAATVSVSNFVFISNASANPAVWVNANAGSLRLANGEITSSAGVGVQVDDTEIVHISNVTFNNQHAALVSTSLTSEVYIDNSRWKVPPLGSYNVRVNGERLPANTTAIALPSPDFGPTAIPNGWQFDMGTTAVKEVRWETTYISQRNSLFVLEADYELVGDPSAWYFQFIVQADTGANTQVAFAPLYPMRLNGASGGTTKRLRIPFFINHGRFKQIMRILVTPTVAAAGASLKLTNIVLFEQGNKFTSDAQVSNMMRCGYNNDAYGMGQTLFSKGKNRLVLTQSEAGVGRPTEVPSQGTWEVGDVVQVYNPVPGGPSEYVCTTAGTPGVWKGRGTLAA